MRVIRTVENTRSIRAGSVTLVQEIGREETVIIQVGEQVGEQEEEIQAELSLLKLVILS